jgi:carboxypeptidase C (cathepsin A)
MDRLNECYAGGVDAICNDADTFCANHVENLFDIYLGRDEYDSRELYPDPFPYEFYVDYLNTPTVQAAIGAVVNFTEGSNAVFEAFTNTGDDGRESNTIEDVRYLLSQGVTVAMYAGDADYNCNWLGGQKVADEVAASGYSGAGYVNITTSDDIVHGQVKQAGKFSFTRIYESGHEVPFYQPLAALELFDRVINGLDVATGTKNATSCYMTVGTKESTYREGNSTFQWDVVSTDLTYDVNTNGPGAPWSQSSRQRRFKP